MDTHNIDICPIERYGYALKSVRDISRICEEEMRESNHMRDITHLYPTLIWNVSMQPAPKYLNWGLNCAPEAGIKGSDK